MSSDRIARHLNRIRPVVEVETAVSETVTPKLVEWLDTLEKAIPRVVSNADEEAVHDLRVAMRRIRSLLRLVGGVYGHYHVRAIRVEFKRVADATGSLRDEEVLRETFDGLKLSKDVRRRLEPWRRRRAQRERTLRTAVVRLLVAGGLAPPIEHLRALLKLPTNPSKDPEVRRFARQVALRAQEAVEARRAAQVEDVLAMHTLRISYKRLRYAVEAFSPSLPPEMRAWEQIAAKFQKVLGNLHDHDVALQVVRRATSLDEELGGAVERALQARRRGWAREYRKLVAGRT